MTTTMPVSSKEMFDNQEFAKTYAKGSPLYPPVLFQMLASLTDQHGLAWDVGTGNGQAAISVCPEFDEALKRWGETHAPYFPVLPVLLNAVPFPFDPVPGVESGKGLNGVLW